MRKLITAALITGVVAVAGFTPAQAANNPDFARTAAAVAPDNSVDSGAIINGEVYQSDINDAVENVLRTPRPSSVWTTTLNANVVTEDKLSPAVRSKLNDDSGTVDGLESDGPYPGATQLQDGANSTQKWNADNGATLQRSWVQCAPGKVAVGGGFSRADEGVAAFKNLQVVTSAPAQIKDGGEVYVPIEGDRDGSFVPNAWLVEGFNNGTSVDLIVRPQVICEKRN